ncbi:MAG: hypothetical protein NTW87_11810 [Planctomycetota bacterium]|nr:hypothetical protein [Planctomycetota bacterium]
MGAVYYGVHPVPGIEVAVTMRLWPHVVEERAAKRSIRRFLHVGQVAAAAKCRIWSA